MDRALMMMNVIRNAKQSQIIKFFEKIDTIGPSDVLIQCANGKQDSVILVFFKDSETVKNAKRSLNLT